MQWTTACVVLSVGSVWAEASGHTTGCPGGGAVSEDDAWETDGDHWKWRTGGGRGQEERAAHFLSESEYLTVWFKVTFLCSLLLAECVSADVTGTMMQIYSYHRCCFEASTWSLYNMWCSPWVLYLRVLVHQIKKKTTIFIYCRCPAEEN